jgi:predicted amidophosphoribosyltransferase
VTRAKQTPPQALLNAKDRRRNLKSAFALTSETDLLGLSEVALVDDVMTTGATMEALASVLKKRFPELRIQVWVLARASGQ